MSEFAFTRRALLALSAVAFVVVMAVHPTWAKAVGVDLWNVPALQQQIHTSEDDIARLDAEDEAIRQRIAIKEGLIANLIAGRTTLAEVTDQFAELDASHPAYMNTLRVNYPDATDRERVARNVISYALPRVAPSERAALSSRLKAELRQMLSGATS